MTRSSIPNALTMMRIASVPIFIFMFYIESVWSNFLVSGVFLAASITDFLDGYLARRWNAHSPFGKFLDPVADKIIVISAIIMLIEFRILSGMHVFAGLIIIVREIVVNALRAFLIEDINDGISVNVFGKIKTALQMCAIFLLILSKDEGGFECTHSMGILFLWIAVFATVISGVIYMHTLLKCIK